jgi:hypothetical protein
MDMILQLSFVFAGIVEYCIVDGPSHTGSARESVTVECGVWGIIISITIASMYGNN